ncbi:thioredoxin [Candidatus Pyrohabitans sp.]
MKVVKVNSRNFKEEVLCSELPVLVDFYAEWCPPCFVIANTLRELAREYEGRVKFVKVDIDESRELAEEYEVFSVPTLAFFADGELVDGVVGALPREALQRKLENFLNGGR